MSTILQQLITAFNAEKQQGKTPEQAVAILNTSSATASAIAAASVTGNRLLSGVETFDLSTVGAVPLSTALVDVYQQDVTALAIAIILKGLGYTPTQIADALHNNYATLGALDTGRILLNALVYPDLSRTDLVSALVAGGYASTDTTLAANILYPITAVIQANEAWQDTGLQVTGTQNTQIAFLSGSWVFNPGYPACGPVGNASLIAKPYYTLPGKPEGALIGRIGDQVFLVGPQYNVPAGWKGSLQLCINDDLTARYGVGLADNTGSLTVKITTSA